MSERESAASVLTEAHLIGIGRIVVEWSATELTLSHLLWEIAAGKRFSGILSNVSEWQASISSMVGMDARVTMGILRAVFHARHPDLSDNFDKIVDKLNKLLKVRHIVAHGFWIKGKRRGSFDAMIFKSSGRMRVEHHMFTAKELNNTADRIINATHSLIIFLESHGYWKDLPPRSESCARAP
jgi:hypothetical protein